MLKLLRNDRRFKVVEIRKDDVIVTHFLHGKTELVEKDIEMFKTKSSKYEMFGKEGMVVWS